MGMNISSGQLEVDNTTLDVNTNGKAEIKNNGVTNNQLSPESINVMRILAKAIQTGYTTIGTVSVTDTPFIVCGGNTSYCVLSLSITAESGIIFDLGQEVNTNLITGILSSPNGEPSYSIQISSDNINWITIGSGSGATTTGFYYVTNKSWRYFKFSSTQSTGGAGRTVRLSSLNIL